jgi:hypothetical protein
VVEIVEAARRAIETGQAQTLMTTVEGHAAEAQRP